MYLSNMPVCMLLCVMCVNLPRTLEGFWVAPMWGNKVDSEAYGSHGTYSVNSNQNTNKNMNSDLYGQITGESSGIHRKYPGWVSRKQGMPISSSFGKRYGEKSVWSLLFDCSINPTMCDRPGSMRRKRVYWQY